MKPYGVRVVEYPDVADIKAMGAKSSCGKFPGPGGDTRGYCASKTKAATRRNWKGKARADGRREIASQRNDI